MVVQGVEKKGDSKNSSVYSNFNAAAPGVGEASKNAPSSGHDGVYSSSGNDLSDSSFNGKKKQFTINNYYCYNINKFVYDQEQAASNRFWCTRYLRCL